ncbi:MFS transporter [uncultured Corynebacterium sp.]|uniref:MFS transporter n=1 Tax=uncultured Corynebacterium sp. TaxID=159447 RepID=UPI0025F3F2F0|nr:MFS transporter [uncultured Corynebacterium sp.]
MPDQHQISRVTGSIAALTLCLAICGVNLPNPLVPDYTDRFALTPLLQSTLFSVYLAALVLTLLATVLDPRRRDRSPRDHVRTLLTALLVSLLADLVMLAGSVSFPLLLTGRALAGVAAGLATGSAASVALAGLGETARTVAAGAAVVGALAANIGVGAVASLTASDTASFLITYLGHGGLAALLAVGLAVSVRTRRRTAPDTPTAAGGTPVVRVVGGYHQRHRTAGYLLGVMSWASAGIVLSLVAARLRQTSPGLSALGAMAPGIVFLTTAWAGQTLVSRRILRLRAWQTSLPLVGGMIGISVALEAGSVPAVLLAAAVFGLGQGPAYSLGMATVTHALPGGTQATMTSVYAAIAYGSCGVLTVAAGMLATSVGVPETCAVAAACCAVGGVVATVLAGPVQQLRVVQSATT